jgi:hypothetical protein
MRTRLFALLLILTAIAFWVISNTSQRGPVTTETESLFLKNYTPQRVIERFQCDQTSSHSFSNGAGAEGDFITHQTGVDWYFVVQADKLTSLMTALNDDLVAQLGLDGAHILSRSGDAGTGFHYDYKLGESVGSVTLHPVKLSSNVHRSTPFPKYMVDVTAKVEVAEKWYPQLTATSTP